MDIWLRENCLGTPPVKQRRAYKSRLVGFPTFVESEGNRHYLTKRIRESCAYRSQYKPSKDAWWCAALTYCGNAPCREPGTCCEYASDDVTRTVDRYRECNKGTKEWPLPAPGLTGGEKLFESETEYLWQYDSGPSCCGGSPTSQINLSNEYTVSRLRLDIDEMLASADWDTDFRQWNTAGDVIGLEEGHFIFPHAPSNYFDAHYFTDDHSNPTWIDKAQMRIKNESDDILEVSLLTYYSSGGLPVESTVSIPAGGEVTVDPPETPGYTVMDMGDGECGFQQCESSNTCPPLDTKFQCENRQRTRTQGQISALLGTCYYCGPLAKDGKRGLFKRVSDYYKFDRTNHVTSSGGTDMNIARHIETYVETVLERNCETSSCTSRKENCSGSIRETRNGYWGGGPNFTEDISLEATYEGCSDVYNGPIRVSGTYSRTATPDVGEPESCEGSIGGVGSSWSGDCIGYPELGDWMNISLINYDLICPRTEEMSGGSGSSSWSQTTTWAITREPTIITATRTIVYSNATETRTDIDVWSRAFLEELDLSEICQDNSEDAEGEPWDGMKDCGNPTANYSEYDSGNTSADDAFVKIDMRYKVVVPPNETGCPDPEEFPAITYRLMWWEIEVPEDCNKPIISTRVEHLIGSFSTIGGFAQVETPIRYIDAAAKLGKKGGKVYAQYPSVFIEP